MLYTAGFDVSQLALGTLTVATAGKTSVVIDLTTVVGITSTSSTSTKFFLLPVTAAFAFYAQNTPDATTSTLTDWSLVPFARELRSVIRTGMTANSWVSPSGFDITYSYTTNHITISYPSANFSLTWSADAGKRLLGYSTSYSSTGATSYEGNQVPYYTIAPSLSRVSDATPNYKSGRWASHVVPDAPVAGFGVSRMYVPLYRDWAQNFETLAKSSRLDALSSHPFTFEQLPEHCGGHFPFLVYDGWASAPTIAGFSCPAQAFMFRNEGLENIGRDIRATKNNNAQFNHRFMTHVIAGVPVS